MLYDKEMPSLRDKILKEAKRAEFEGRRYKISSKGNPTGIFGPQYYHFFLEPLDE